MNFLFVVVACTTLTALMCGTENSDLFVETSSASVRMSLID